MEHEASTAKASRPSVRQRPGAGVTQSSEAGGSDELHELAVTHAPKQALQAALAWKTDGTQATLPAPAWPSGSPQLELRPHSIVSGGRGAV